MLILAIILQRAAHLGWFVWQLKKKALGMFAVFKIILKTDFVDAILYERIAVHL